VTAEVSKPVRDLRIGLRVTDTSGAVIFSTANTDDEPDAGLTQPGRFTYDCEIPAPLLRPGRYMVSALALTRYAILDEHLFVVGFDVLPGAGKANPGVVIPRLRWTLHDNAAARAVSQ
jgi:hypothetical protein